MERSDNAGFTLVELVFVLAIVGILVVLSFPRFTGYAQRARLRSAARNVYADMQLARIRAIQSGGRWRVLFDPDTETYMIVNPGPNMILDTKSGTTIRGDDVVEKVVPLGDRHKGIRFGTARGKIPTARSTPDDGVSFTGDRVEFLPMGRANKGGTVYLKNDREETFAVSLEFNNARVKLWRNYGGGWEN